MNELLLGGGEGQEGAFQMGLFTLLPGTHSTNPIAQCLHPGLLGEVEGEINRYRVFGDMSGSPACLHSVAS